LAVNRAIQHAKLAMEALNATVILATPNIFYSKITVFLNLYQEFRDATLDFSTVD
jgi:hypothetical protein